MVDVGLSFVISKKQLFHCTYYVIMILHSRVYRKLHLTARPLCGAEHPIFVINYLIVKLLITSEPIGDHENNNYN